MESKYQKIIDQMPSYEEVETVAQALRQLGDASRLRIFWLLCHHEACVLDIANIVQMSSPAVSFHLRVLKASNLVVSERHGKEMYYQAADTELVDLLHHTIEHLASIACPGVDS
ncbi:MAG: ArsR/SmtB family transcription factor [bacterium]